MSYSFTVTGGTLAQALAAAVEKFDTEVLADQPAHARDRDAAFANAHASGLLLDLGKQGDQLVQITMHGSVSAVDATEEDPQGATVACSVGCAICYVAAE